MFATYSPKHANYVWRITFVISIPILLRLYYGGKKLVQEYSTKREPNRQTIILKRNFTCSIVTVKYSYCHFQSLNQTVNMFQSVLTISVSIPGTSQAYNDDQNNVIRITQEEECQDMWEFPNTLSHNSANNTGWSVQLDAGMMIYDIIKLHCNKTLYLLKWYNQLLYIQHLYNY